MIRHIILAAKLPVKGRSSNDMQYFKNLQNISSTNLIPRQNASSRKHNTTPKRLDSMT